MGAFDNHKFEELYSRIEKVEAAILELSKPKKKTPAKKKTTKKDEE